MKMWKRIRKTACLLGWAVFLVVMASAFQCAQAGEWERAKVWMSLSSGENSLKMPDPYPVADMVSRGYSWVSSDESVVTVSSAGVLTARSEGTAVISCGPSYEPVTCEVIVGQELTTMKIPDSVSVIEEEAFVNVSACERIDLPANLSRIGDRAFADNEALLCVQIPPSVETFGEDLFAGCPNVSIQCARGSAAEAYAKENGIPFLFAAPEKPVEEIRFYIGGVPMAVGSTYRLRTSIIPEDASEPSVTWHTTNPEILTVKDGLVTSHEAGYAYAWAESNDGYARASCYFQVKNVDIASIALEAATLPMTVGTTYQMPVEILPANATFKTLRWQSSRPEVASVADGLLTAHAAGTTVITASATDGSGVAASCEVEVISSSVAVSGVWCSETECSLPKGEKHQLEARVIPGTAAQTGIYWYSNNSLIASVDSTGLITARSEGTTKIFAASAADSACYAVCDVTVLPPIKVNSVVCDQDELLLGMGSSTWLTASAFPENAYDRSIVWSTSHTDVVTLTSDGYVTAKDFGTAAIFAKPADGSNVYDVCYVEVYQPDAIIHPQNHHAYQQLRPVDHLPFGGNTRFPERYASIIDQFNVDFGENDSYNMGWYEYWSNSYAGMGAVGFAADVSYAMGCFMPMEYCCGRCGKPTSSYAFRNCDAEYVYTGGYMWQGIDRIQWFCTCANRYTVSSWSPAWVYEWFTGEGDNLKDKRISYSFGWTECDAESAVFVANKGRLTIGVNEDHIFVVHPNERPGMYISQAGDNLMDNEPMPYDVSEYRYYYCTGVY